MMKLRTQGRAFSGTGSGRLTAAVLVCLGALSVVTAPPAVATVEWRATASMVTARSHHTATLLPSGEVLVAGGKDASGLPTASAELYDPVAGTWRTTAPLAVPRASHTATLLDRQPCGARCGLVLVTGGTSGNPQSSAELYDPATGLWLPAAPLTDLRADHTATLLSNGEVLVAGGVAGGVAEEEVDLGSGVVLITDTAELYDPVAGTWSGADPMTRARAHHTATLLPNGRVLVAGRIPPTGGQSGPGKTAELYDPGTGAWSATGPLDADRANHTATLLPDGTVVVAGGDAGVAAAEVYDPGTATWSVRGAMATARTDHTATLLTGGEVVVAGGGTDGAERYQPLVGAWTTAGSLGAARSAHTATLLPNGEVLVAGGISPADEAPLDSAELYDPAAVPTVASVGDVSLHEGNAGTRTAVFTVALSAPAQTTVTVSYGTADGTASSSDGDFAARAGTLTFAPGSTSSTVKVLVAGDTADEADETFGLVLSDPTGVVIADGTAAGTILDDDPATASGPTLAIGDVSVHEGDGGTRTAVFNVSLSKPRTSYVTVSFATAKGTATGTDYTAKTGTLTFTPGTTSLNVKVAVTPDDVAEGVESFGVNLSGASGAGISDPTGVGTIVDDD